MNAAQKKFLRYVREVVIDTSSRPGVTAQEAARMTAFCILVALDGEAAACGPYEVRPLDTKGKPGSDIAGSLHEWFCQDATVAKS